MRNSMSVPEVRSVLRAVRRAVTIIVLSQAELVLAYEVETHRDLSSAAVDGSVLATPSTLSRLGLRPLSTFNEGQKFPQSGGSLDVALTIRELFRFGAGWEDDLAASQALRHFYDPVNDRALDLAAPAGTTFSVKSQNWALEDLGTFGAPASQDFSYGDARQSFYDALTSTVSEGVRKRQFGRTFQTLGHVIHHLQDMAQPQHVRNDPHCDHVVCKMLAELTGSNGLYAPSRYEHYSDLNNADVPFSLIRSNLPVAAPNSAAVYPGLDVAANPFKAPRHFWRTTAPGSDISTGKGIAEFTNRNFYSEGSISAYPSPRPQYTITDYFRPTETVDIGVLMPGTVLTGKVSFWGTEVTDALSGGPPVMNRRALSEGLLDSDLVQFYATASPGQPSFALNRFTFDAAHQFLIPRAVAYSAGLINYFFRGQLEISAPDEGVYGIVDHTVESAPHVGGFRTIKLKLRNVTPGGTGTDGEPLIEAIPENGGSFVAVVKFHRNLCYQPDLSGEYGSPGIDWRICRSPTEEIVVSQPAAAPSGINQSARPMTFTFQNKVPIEATDVYLQVVYRGQLGEEADAVVVATKDISEPTYIVQFVTADQYLYCWNGVLSQGNCESIFTFQQSFCDQRHPELTLDQCKARYGLVLKFRPNPVAQPLPGYDPAAPAYPPGTWFPVASEPPFAPVGTLPAAVGSFARIAVLVDLAPSDPYLVVTEEGVGAMASSFMWQTGGISPTLNQVDPVSGAMSINRSYAQARGVYVDTVPVAGNPALSSHAQLSAGTASNIPPLVLVSSQVTF